MIVEKIDKFLDALNERMMKHFTNVLEKLEDVLVKINDRADKVEGNGMDVSSVRTAIETAHQAISMARTAIETQTGKTHTITITTEEGLKTEIGKARQALHDEIRLVFEKVKLAKEAVHNAARALAGLRGGEE